MADQKTAPYNPATDPDMYDPKTDPDMVAPPAAAAAPAPASTPTPAPTPGALTDDQIREQEDKQMAGGMSALGSAGSQRPNAQLGLPDKDRIISLGYDPAKIQKSWLYNLIKSHSATGSGFDFMLDRKTKDDLMGSLQRGPFGGFAHGINNLVMGGEQDVVHLLKSLGLSSDEDAAYVDSLAKLNEENYRQNIHPGEQPGWWTQRATELAPIIPELAAREFGINLPGAGPNAGWGARAAGGAGMGTIYGGLNPVTDVDPKDPNSFAKKKAAQTGMGALLGGAFGAGAEPAVKGLVGLGWRGLNTIFGKAQLPEDLARSFQQTLESRASGNGWGPNLQRVQQAANSGDKRVASIAKNVLDQLYSADASGKPGDITQAAISMQDLLTRIDSNALWDNVTQIGNKYGTAPALNTMKTMRTLINDLTKRNLKPNPQLADLIESYRQNFITDTQQGKVPRQVDFDQMRQFLSEIQGDIDAAHDKTGQTFITNTQTPYLAKIRDAMRDDIEDFLQSKNANDLRQAWETAKDHYATYRAPFADKLISKAGATPEADSIIDMFTKPGGADRAHSLFQSLDPRGQDTVKSQMINKLIQAGTAAEEEQITPQSKAITDGYVNPGKMLKALQKYKEPFNAFFSGADQKALGGLENLLRHGVAVEGKYSLVPKGIAGGLMTAAGHAAGLPWSTDLAGFPIGAGAIHLALTTQTGRRLLYKALAEKPGTPGMAAIAKQLGDLGAIAARAGARYAPSFATQPAKGPITVKPWDPNWQPPPQFRSGGLARLRSNTLRALQAQQRHN